MKNKGIGIAMMVILGVIAVSLITLMILAIVNKDKGFKVSLFSFEDKTKLIYENSYNMSEIKDIDIKASSQHVKFIEGNNDEIKVTIYGSEDEEYRVSLDEDGKLQISRENKAFHIFVFMAWIREEIIVELPKGYEGHVRNKSIKWECTTCGLR